MLIRHTYQFNHINTAILTGLHVMVFNATFNNISVISSLPHFCPINVRGRRVRDRIVVGCTATYAISAYSH
jgi:hypothetical protein